MSLHVEWDRATSEVVIAEPGEEMPDGQSIEPGWWGLVLGGAGGALLVVEGTPDELVAYAAAVTDAAMGIRRRVADANYQAAAGGDVTPAG